MGIHVSRPTYKAPGVYCTGVRQTELAYESFGYAALSTYICSIGYSVTVYTRSCLLELGFILFRNRHRSYRPALGLEGEFVTPWVTFGVYSAVLQFLTDADEVLSMES